MNLEKIKQDSRMPRHVAFIVDGNGRWAKHRGLPRSFGHQVGADNVEKIIEFSRDLGIKNVTFYCFSTENWKRSKQEVDFLMEKFEEMLDKYKEKYLNEDVRMIISGDMTDCRLPLAVRKKAIDLMEETKHNTGFYINMCINYGGRQEILMAIKKLIDSGNKEINQETFEKCLYTADLLPVDFIVRTSGEQRTSNFLPWQSTYSEWYFAKKNWPSFKNRDFIKALKAYMKRNRRYGAVKG